MLVAAQLPDEKSPDAPVSCHSSDSSQIILIS